MGGDGPPCPSLEKHLSSEWGSYGSMGGWMRGRVNGLRGKMVSRHSLGKHNSMQGRNVLRATPTPLFIAFLGF